MPSLLTLLVLAVAYGLSDRFTGGGFGWDRLTVNHGGPLRGRGLYYVALPLLGISWFLGGTFGAVVAAIWILGRSLPFPAGTLVGRNLGKTFLRHGVVLPFLFLAIVSLGRPPETIWAFVAYAGVATLLAAWHGREVAKGHDVNWIVETARGAAFGLAAGLVFTP